MKFLLFAMLGFTGSVPLFAAEQDLNSILPPKPPFIAAPPANGQWIIKGIETKLDGAGQRKAASAEGDNAAQPKVDQVLCVKTGEIKRDIFVGRNGKQSEIRYVVRLALTTYENSDGIALVDAASFGPQTGTRTGSLIFSARFPGFDWLNISHYKGAVKVGEKSCYHFEMPASQPYKQLVPEDGGVKEMLIAPQRWRGSMDRRGNQAPRGNQDGGICVFLRISNAAQCPASTYGQTC